MRDFHLELSDLSFVGKDLSRPESVVATASGDVFTSDIRGGVTHIRPDGSQTLIGGPHLPAKGLHPNGIALMKDGSFLFANSGTGEAGGVWRLHRNGQVEPFLLEVDGVTLPRTNFVWLDDADRIWVCVSTVHRPNSQYSKDRPDGFIAMVDHRGARIAGTGIVWTNECRIDPSGKYLYFNETFASRVSRFRLAADGTLSGKEVVAELGPGNFPDGLTFDEQGGAWITCIVSNRLIRIDADGSLNIVIEDYEPDHLARAIAAIENGTLTRPMVHENHHRTLGNISSLAFGGADRRTAYMGSILGKSLVAFRSPIAGARPAHWDVH
jgi:sugar lactone lactonase YvrE